MDFYDAKQNESTLMERICREGDFSEGNIQNEQIPSLLQNLHPELTIDEKELQRLIGEYDRDGSGLLDFESIIKIIFHFLLKQSADSSTSTTHLRCEDKNCSKTRLTLQDFVIFNNL